MSKKILIVDDSPFIIMVLKSILKKIFPDAQLYEASCEADAIKRFKTLKPDLTLLDIIMPETAEAGLNVLKNIMKIDCKSKVVMVTAVSHDAMVKRCKEMGASDYLVKPFDEADIEKTIKGFM